MTGTSLEPIFITATADTSTLAKLTQGNLNMTILRHAVEELPFNSVYDFIRSSAHRLCTENRTQEAIDRIIEFDTAATRHGQQSGKLLDIHAALMQAITAIYISDHRVDEALTSAASTLTLLAQEPRRKDEPFLSVLASLLYDIALIHFGLSQYRQAEREIEKSMKIFQRLAKSNPERYSSAVTLAMNASTQVFRSREKQTKMLAEYHEATETYLRQTGEGVEGAGMRLVESIAEEGRTLVKMNRQREAVQYFTRALRYLTKIDPTFNRLQLQLSIDLGEALLAIKGSREKGIHLLNTMLYKATKIGANDEHRQIVDILLNAKNNSLDIFGFWHKLFPR